MTRPGTKRGEKFQQAESLANHAINGWYASEKLDGMRVRLENGKLITMLENALHVPQEWIEQLPNGVVLDGELYLENGSRQELLAIVKDHIPDRQEWKRVTYNVFDIINADRYIDNYPIICSMESAVIKPVKQVRLPFRLTDAREQLRSFTAEIINRGGEGAMVRDPLAPYRIGRHDRILKVKPRKDAEARIVGFRTGQGKFSGMIGSICVKAVKEGTSIPIHFDISGLTDEERTLSSEEAKRWAIINPGKVLPENMSAEYFSRGTYITFKYRGVTNDGIPMEAQYFRKRDPAE